MNDCEKCRKENCGVLNPDQCPINQLWKAARIREEALEEVVEILKGGKQ